MKKLKLNDYQKIEDNEMKSIIGGLNHTGDGSINNPYELPEIIVTPAPVTGCRGCELWEEYTNNPVNPGGPFTPIGNWIANQFLPHTCGKW